MDISVLILFFAGLALLIIGAESLVRGSSRLAASVGISPLVVGLTVVAFGTSTPELAVSVRSGLSGNPDIALGNVVGSNVFNVLFILGLSAAITPLSVDRMLIRFDVPIMIGVSALTLLIGLDGAIGRGEGAFLAFALAVYTAFIVWKSRRESAEVRKEFEREFGGDNKAFRKIASDVFFIAAGLSMLVTGSRLLVNGAVAMAQAFGVSELMIGLTIIAAGTSLPEVATSVVASIRRESDIAVGNIIGSNIFNIMAVLGVSALLTPGGMDVSPKALWFDIPVMIAVAAACLPVFYTGRIIARWEGALFLAYYAAYTVYLLLESRGSGALKPFMDIMVVFVIPLTILTLLITSVRSLMTARRKGER